MTEHMSPELEAEYLGIVPRRPANVPDDWVQDRYGEWRRSDTDTGTTGTKSGTWLLRNEEQAGQVPLSVPLEPEPVSAKLMTAGQWIAEHGLASMPDPEPVVPLVVRDDGEAVLPVGVSCVFGAPKAGKTYTTAAITAAAVEAGWRVLVLHAAGDSDAADWKAKLELLTVEATDDWTVARYDDLMNVGGVIPAVAAWVGSQPHQWLLVVDSVTGLARNVNDQDSARELFGSLQPLIDVAASTILIAHEPKNNLEGSRRQPLGSTAWAALVDTNVRVTRSEGDEWVTLTVSGRSTAPSATRLRLVPGEPARWCASSPDTVRSDRDDDRLVTDLMAAILSSGGYRTRTDWAKAVSGHRATVLAATKDLIERGVVAERDGVLVAVTEGDIQ